MDRKTRKGYNPGNHVPNTEFHLPFRPQQTDRVKRLLLIPAFLLLARLTCRANPPDYLTYDREPAVEASQLASPFTELVTEQPAGWLRPLSSEPFIRYAGFSAEPRLYYRYLQNSSGLREAFAAGGSQSFTTGWWRDTLQLGVTGYTTQPVIAPNGAGNTGLLRSNGDGLSVLGQAWAKVKAGPATATLFRQSLQLPFINGNDSRMIPNTFDAYQLEVEPCETLRLNFGYVSGMKAFRAGPGVAAPRAKALGFSVLPLRGKIGSLFSQHPRAAAGGGFEQVFRIPGSAHPDGPEKLGICLWASSPSRLRFGIVFFSAFCFDPYDNAPSEDHEKRANERSDEILERNLQLSEPKVDSEQLEQLAADHRAGHADQEVRPAAQALLFESDSTPRKSAREAADNDPYNDLADVHEVNVTFCEPKNIHGSPQKYGSFPESVDFQLS
jgi:hypothetical protein